MKKITTLTILMTLVASVADAGVWIKVSSKSPHSKYRTTA